MDFPGVLGLAQPGAVGVGLIIPDAGAAGIRQVNLAGNLEAFAVQRYREPDGFLKPVEEPARGRAHRVVVTAKARQVLVGSVFQSALRA
jgi:hypothetical protein